MCDILNEFTLTGDLLNLSNKNDFLTKLSEHFNMTLSKSSNGDGNFNFDISIHCMKEIFFMTEITTICDCFRISFREKNGLVNIINTTFINNIFGIIQNNTKYDFKPKDMAYRCLMNSLYLDNDALNLFISCEVDGINRLILCLTESPAAQDCNAVTLRYQCIRILYRIVTEK